MKEVNQQREMALNKVFSYLKIDNFNVSSEDACEAIKELCVARLCKSMGIRCKYNYKNDFFEFFSSVTAEAVCRHLNLKYNIVDEFFKFYRFEHINLLEEVENLIKNEDVDEAFIDIFLLMDQFKYLMPMFNKSRK